MDTTNDKGAPRSGTPSKTPPNNSNSAHDQRKLLIDWLIEHGSIDTITARRELDILMPGARIHELRHKHGHAIDTVTIIQASECGKLHPVAKYVLKDWLPHE
jgi:hypothetical protein